jgi:hypothetical protein
MERVMCPFCGKQTEYIDERKNVVGCTNACCNKVWEVKYTDKLKEKYHDRQQRNA